MKLSVEDIQSHISWCRAILYSVDCTDPLYVTYVACCTLAWEAALTVEPYEFSRIACETSMAFGNVLWTYINLFKDCAPIAELVKYKESLRDFAEDIALGFAGSSHAKVLQALRA